MAGNPEITHVCECVCFFLGGGGTQGLWSIQCIRISPFLPCSIILPGFFYCSFIPAQLVLIQ